MKRSVLLISVLALVSFFTAATCFAGQYDLKNITPEIDRALKARQARYLELQVLKRSGVVGENNRGYVTGLKGDPSEAAVVSAENSDRGIIYRALVDQNSLGPNGMKEVERAFAEVQSEKAEPGEMVQSPSGDWARKS